MTRHYEKLVRDRIPEMIENGGSRCVTRILEDGEYREMLRRKLSEELQEYLESGEAEELADLLEVMRAAAEAQGVAWEEIEGIRQKKKAARGGFEKRILLLQVED